MKQKPAAFLFIVLILSPLNTLAAPSNVPSQYQSMYDTLDGQLNAFNSVLNSQYNGNKPPVNFGAELLTANSHRGEALLDANAYYGVDYELDRLQAMGVKSVTVAIQFPLFFEPFFQWNGNPEDYQKYIDFYTKLSEDIHGRGMKLVVESAAIFPGVYSQGSGFKVGEYYPLITNGQYFYGRAQTAKNIIKFVKPDYLTLGAEPDTEVYITGKPLPATADGYAVFLKYLLDEIDLAGGRGTTKIGAGVGFWMPNASNYLSKLTALNLDYIDFHTYPANKGLLLIGLGLINQAQAAGKAVAMSEVWINKETDEELVSAQQGSDATIFSRDAFSFWSPLDQKFLKAMVNLAYSENFVFLSPFWSRYFFSYLDFPQVNTTDPGQIIALSNAASANAILLGNYSDTGLYYSSLISSNPDTTPPSVPTNLQIATTSPLTVNFSWVTSTDPVVLNRQTSGLLGYKVYRNNSLVTTTTSLNFSESLNLGGVYNYSVASYDLSGNTSATTRLSIILNSPSNPTPPPPSPTPTPTPTPAPSPSPTPPAPSPTPQTPTSSVKLINDSGTFYLVEGGLRKGITNPGLLASYGFEFKDAVSATEQDKTLPLGPLLLPGNGALVKSRLDPTVFLISNGQKYGFTSEAVFLGLGFKFSSVVVVTAPELESQIFTGLISDPKSPHLPGVDINRNGTIYWVGSDLTLHGYPSLEVYNSWHADNNFTTVVPANSADLTLPIGSLVELR